MRAAFGFGFGLPLGGGEDSPAVDWNFAGGALPSALTFSRASTATYYNAAGTLVTAASGSPRLTYDPVTHSALGLLVEEQRTNLLLNSLLDGTNLSTQSVTVAATQYTLSFYGTGQIVLSGSATATVVGTGAFPTQKTYTFTPSAGSLTLTVTGTVQFAQLEAGAFATSYIPTGAASATRAADVVTCTGAAFSQWFNPSEGTLVVEAVMPNADLGPANVLNLVYVGDGPGNEYIKVYQYETVFGAAIRHSGAWQADVSGTKTAGAVEKLAVAWAANDAAVAIRGALVGTDATVSVPTGIDRLTLGTGSPGAVACTIKRVRYWRKRITNAQLQALTA